MRSSLSSTSLRNREGCRLTRIGFAGVLGGGVQLLRVDGIVSVTRLASFGGKGQHRRGAASGREAQAAQTDSDSEGSGDDCSDDDE